MSIVNHLSREMGARRLSIQDVARQAQLSYGAVFELFHGRAKRIDLQTLDKLCGTLGVGVGDLFEFHPSHDGQDQPAVAHEPSMAHEVDEAAARQELNAIRVTLANTLRARQAGELTEAQANAISTQSSDAIRAIQRRLRQQHAADQNV